MLLMTCSIFIPHKFHSQSFQFYTLFRPTCHFHSESQCESRSSRKPTWRSRFEIGRRAAGSAATVPPDRLLLAGAVRPGWLPRNEPTVPSPPERTAFSGSTVRRFQPPPSLV